MTCRSTPPSTSSSIRTTSTAPSAARMPHRIAPPSKAGPGGRGRGHDRVAVAEHDLAVGADVDEQPGALVAVHAGGQHPGDDVAADVRAEGREDHRPGPRVQRQAEVGGEQRRQACVRGHDERRDAERLGVDAEHQRGHRGVAGQRDLVDLVRRRRRPRRARRRSSSASVSWAASRSRSAACGSIIVALIRVITSPPNGCCLLSIDATAAGRAGRGVDAAWPRRSWCRGRTRSRSAGRWCRRARRR